jgi:hypothetical protein
MLKNAFSFSSFKKNKIIPLVAIFLIGLFLRVYHFHDWLSFEQDQARDAVLADNVISGKSAWPASGPSMRKSNGANGELFHLGPIYYQFQVISAKLFGNYPDKLAYPDLFFGVLTILLFYYFFKKYFSINLSLALTGLYATSYYAIEYSRFAWNPNSIPFFVLLFLLALYEFLVNKEKTGWIWAIFLGTAIGIGIQLHIILLMLFPATAFIVFVYLLKQNRKIISRLLLVLGVILIFNLGQLISEYKNNFANTKILLSPSSQKINLLDGLEKNFDYHIEANPYILSSLGDDTCGFSYVRLLNGDDNKQFRRNLHDFSFETELFLGLAFSLFGYAALVYFLKNEKDEKRRYFLDLVGLYLLFSFLIMLEVIRTGMDEYRYFIPCFFVPFLFLGFLAQKLVKKYVIITSLLFIFLAIANFSSLEREYEILSTENKNSENLVVLGETEKMADYLATGANKDGKIYLVGNVRYVSNFFGPLSYLLKKRGLVIINSGSEGIIPTNGNAFYIWKNGVEKTEQKLNNKKIESAWNLGQIGIYKLQN